VSGEVTNLLEEAMLLSSESRIELIEAILEQSAPSEEFISQQVAEVERRMKNVRDGSSHLIPEREAHERVVDSLTERQ
jgi:hypothetical protein